MPTAIRDSADETVQRGRGRPRDEVARARILEAALEVLQEVGFANSTTDTIAERAGASKATIYRWWPNKGAVLVEALRQQISREAPFPDTGDLRQDVHLQLQNFVAFLNGWRGRVFKAFIAAAQSDPVFAEAFRSDWIMPRRMEAIAILRKHQQKGAILTHIDLGVVLDLIYGPLYFRLLAEHGPLTPEFARLVGEMALQGLMTSCS